ncbi:MAG TPA: TetR family transcriptional regulator [Thermoanaerobaculia bacterium]|jgi:AcrR family transcriptional regulator|nr:TetR family transcriptional regulator [Thermoanaerobaculia bacterium]
MRDPASATQARAASAAAGAADPVAGGGAKTLRGEQTREQILEAALALFRDQGYEGTTMRAIARQAGVAVGNAYYYFRSKESLIQEFYRRTHREHLAACAGVLATEGDFKARLAGVMRAKVDTMMPYHRFAGVLFKTAADPASPLNPWSPESGPLRREATAVFAAVVAGSRQQVKGELREALPALLWTYHMGVILYWIHDTSAGCRRTYRLVDDSVDLVSRLLALSRLPPLRPLVRIARRFVSDLAGEP